MVDYGIMLLKNMNTTDLQSCNSVTEPQISNNSRLFGYFIIPQYQVSLESIINSSEEKNIQVSPKKILDINIQLLNSL